MLRYNVRSRQLVDIVGDIKRKKLIISPYFQRNLVWRTIHKVDFIKTILLGYPFPEIFTAKGDLDIEKMTYTECVVDGQQRLNSIVEFIEDKFSVDGKNYSELTIQAKENFLKYEIAVIELDIKHDDQDIKEIFKRLNRTFYSLSFIEKLSTEYAPSELMLLAKLISGELRTKEEREYLDFDPQTPSDFIEWSKNVPVGKIKDLIVESPIFSSYEISRQVHLMFALNIIGTMVKGIYNRNITKDMLEEFAEDFKLKDEIVENLEFVAAKVLKMKLKKDSYWYNKANMFSLIIAFYNNREKLAKLNEKDIKDALEDFAVNVPEDFKLAAKEGVNNKRERIIRNNYLQEIIDKL